MKKIFLVAVLLSTINLSAQKAISFLDNAYESAIALAKKEGKDVFVDTYAPWCKPCKKMDRVFRNPNVGELYNDKFINVKINVDRPEGKRIADKFGIAFLPTMLIIDENENVKQRIDGLMSADQLIAIGVAVSEETPMVVMETSPKSVTKLSKKVKAEVTPVAEPGEKILFVLDDPKAQENPDYLYHEAFFRFQQMDGSHDSIVRKYLETQEDWSSEKNLQFIINFLDNTQSDLFDYFVQESEKFRKVMGADQYRKTLEIMINDCLYRQIPRPEPERVEELFALLYPRKAEKYTYQYLLQRYEDQDDFESYVTTAEDYLETLIQPDPDLLYKLGKYKCLSANRNELKECIFRVEESIRISNEVHYDQYLTLAKLYHKQDKERKSKDALEKAKSISLGDTEARRRIEAFENKLDRS